MSGLFIPKDLKINFIEEKKQVTGITIETPRLKLLAVSNQVLKEHPEIIEKSPYYDKAVMAKFANEQVRDREKVTKQCDMWAKRLAAQDPFVGFAVFDKNTGAFIGLVIPGHGAKKGSSEPAGLLHKIYWNQRIATEAAGAMLVYYTELAKRGFKINGYDFKEIIATVSPENPYSEKILKKAGMTSEGSISSDTHGRPKLTYRITVNKLLELYGGKQKAEIPASLWKTRVPPYVIAGLLTAFGFLAYRGLNNNSAPVSSVSDMDLNPFKK